MNRILKMIPMRAQKEEHCIKQLNLLREYLSNHEQDVGRNMDNRDQDGNEELIIENCKRFNPYCKVANKQTNKTLVNCVSVQSLVKGRTEYQAETISKQNVELELFLTADSKIQTKRLDLKMRLLSNKEAEFKIRKMLSLSILQKMRPPRVWLSD